MLSLSDAKLWLHIDDDDEGYDPLILSLIDASAADIQFSTGIPKDYKDNVAPEALDNIQSMYEMCQKIAISDLFYERDTANKALHSYYTKLELEYRRGLKDEA